MKIQIIYLKIRRKAFSLLTSSSRTVPVFAVSCSIGPVDTLGRVHTLTAVWLPSGGWRVAVWLGALVKTVGSQEPVPHGSKRRDHPWGSKPQVHVGLPQWTSLRKHEFKINIVSISRPLHRVVTSRHGAPPITTCHVTALVTHWWRWPYWEEQVGGSCSNLGREGGTGPEW